MQQAADTSCKRLQSQSSLSTITDDRHYQVGPRFAAILDTAFLSVGICACAKISEKWGFALIHIRALGIKTVKIKHI